MSVFIWNFVQHNWNTTVADCRFLISLFIISTVHKNKCRSTLVAFGTNYIIFINAENFKNIYSFSKEHIFVHQKWNLFSKYFTLGNGIFKMNYNHLEHMCCMISIESLIVCCMYQCWAVIKNGNKPQWVLRFPNCHSQEIKRSHNHDSQSQKKNTQQNQIAASKTAGSFMKTIGSWCFWNNKNPQFFHSELFYNF